MSRGVLWRIHPEQCIYGRLNIYDQEFSTKRNLSTMRLQIGDYVYPLAAGKEKNKGLLGIWQITVVPYIASTREVQVYTTPFREMRSKPQWRLRARQISECIPYNLELLIELQGCAKLPKQQQPYELSMEQQRELWSLAIVVPFRVETLLANYIREDLLAHISSFL